MKKIFTLTLFLLALYACRKDATPPAFTQADFQTTFLNQLLDSLTPADRLAIDTRRIYRTPPDGNGQILLRIPFSGKACATDFVLARTDAHGVLLAGRIIHIERTGPGAPAPFNGYIGVASLGRRGLMESAITNGFIEALQPEQKASVTELGTNRETSLLDPYVPLPQCIVIGYPNKDGYIDVSGYYISLAALLPIPPIGAPVGGTGSGSGSGSGIGGSFGGGAGSGNTGAAGGVGGGAPYYPLTLPDTTTGQGMFPISPASVQPEYTNNIPAVNVTRVFNCFNPVSSESSTFTVTLCTDVPVNGDPLAVVNSGGSTFGHSFLVATVTNGSNSVTQSFGFYPTQVPSALSPLDGVPSSVKDNGGQEINGSITMTVTADQFESFKETAIQAATNLYYLDVYNCTDYALQCFNSMRPTPLALVPITIELPATPSTNYPPITINNSPQMLYALLAAMKTNNAPEAANIQLDLTGKTKAPASHGECN